MVHIWNPSTEKAQIGDTKEVSVVYLVSPKPMKDPVSENKTDGTWGMTSKVDFRPLIPTHTRLPAHTMPTCKDPHGWRGKLQDSTGADHSNTRLQWAAAVKDEKRWATWACDSCPHWKTLRATGKEKRWTPKFVPQEDSGKQASKVTSSTLQGTHP